MRRLLRGFFLVIGTLSIALGVLGVVARWTGGPIGPIPGGSLQGSFAPEGMLDAGPLASRSQIQLQVRPASPRSMNVWVIVLDGEIYVPSGLAPWKQWPQQLLQDERVVLRVDDRLYDRSAVRVTDPALVARLVEAVRAKYGVSDRAGSDRTWFFHLVPRG